MDSSTCLRFALKARHEQHSTKTNSTIKTSNKKLNMKNLQNKSALESSKHFYNI